MRRLEIGPACPGGFLTGTRVIVNGGPHGGEDGLVVDRRPDLRPGSVWVRLERAGTRLIPGHRLAIQ
jgi:hypothetical protein